MAGTVHKRFYGILYRVRGSLGFWVGAIKAIFDIFSFKILVPRGNFPRLFSSTPYPFLDRL